MIVYSQGRRLTLVSWDEPVFEGAVSMIRPEYQSGKTSMLIFIGPLGIFPTKKCWAQLFKTNNVIS